MYHIDASTAEQAEIPGPAPGIFFAPALAPRLKLHYSFKCQQQITTTKERIMATMEITQSVTLNGVHGTIIQTFEPNENIGLGPSNSLTSTEFVPAPNHTEPQYKFERVGSVRLAGVQHKTYHAYVRLPDGAWQLHQTIYAPMRMPKRDLPTLLDSHFVGQ